MTISFDTLCLMHLVSRRSLNFFLFFFNRLGWIDLQKNWIGSRVNPFLLLLAGIESHTFNKLIRDVQQQECLNLKIFGLTIYPQQFSLSQPHIIFSPLSWINLDYMTFTNYLAIYLFKKKKTMWITWYAYYIYNS